MAARKIFPLPLERVPHALQSVTRQLWGVEAASKREWASLYVTIGAIAQAASMGDRDAAERLLQRALDLEYDITGSCDYLDPIREASGFRDYDKHTRQRDEFPGAETEEG